MTAPHHILLSPIGGDPQHLLTCGRGGARPPLAYQDALGVWRLCGVEPSTNFPGVLLYEDQNGPLVARAALVLAWDGEEEEDGTWRVRARVGGMGIRRAVRSILDGDGWYARQLQTDGPDRFGGMAVFLGADGREMAVEEISP